MAPLGVAVTDLDAVGADPPGAAGVGRGAGVAAASAGCGVGPQCGRRFRPRVPDAGAWLDRLGLFEVYASPWFAAIYLLLLVSMTGCVLPRCARLWRAARAAPPRAPSNLARLPGHPQVDTDATSGDVLRLTAETLRRRGFRVGVDGATVRAEKGYLREVGNLLFHLSLLVLLFGVAVGALFEFEGRVVVAEGGGFSNAERHPRVLGDRRLRPGDARLRGRGGPARPRTVVVEEAVPAVPAVSSGWDDRRSLVSPPEAPGSGEAPTAGSVPPPPHAPGCRRRLERP